MAGVLGSLVSITAICGVVRPAESLAIGFIGAAITIFGWQLLNRLKIDDPVGAVSTHAGGSVWAMIAVGLFVEKEILGVMSVSMESKHSNRVWTLVW